MGTHRLATQRARVIMKFFALLSATLAAASAQYPIPVTHAGLGYALAAYGAYPSFGVAPAAYHTAAPLAVAAPVAPVAPVAVAPIAPEVTSSQYVDEAGHHSVSYIADDLGYRVIGRTRRSAQVAPVAYAGAHLVGAVAPAAYAAVAPAAVAVAAPAAPAREAVLTTIKLNPGHAVFYRVD